MFAFRLRPGPLSPIPIRMSASVSLLPKCSDVSFSRPCPRKNTLFLFVLLCRYFCLAVWPSIFATCNRRDKNKLSLPVQYCHFGSIHLTTDVSTKKISVSQYCPNNTLQITSIQLIININHMAARSGSSRWIPSVAGGKTYNISWSNGLQDYTQLFRSVWDQY